MSLLGVLVYVQAGFMFAALPLSLLAAYGFRGTPWGRVLSPLPVMEVAFSIGLGIGILGGSGDWLLVQAGAYGVGVVAVSLLSFRLARLATGGVRT
ncbi:hypothetical protein [Halobacterium bonnevillei]|uniref:Uncharacterized protein n=1 Tax=Halobacterium bonnevillei TaxID=2692200 RepID=A0A6B0SCQ3_9EURY|nr:hypothetical protein [Halobacterium bonnevillei]MXR19525.1 hypothetical protein [Halobacterium bonnevillei]